MLNLLKNNHSEFLLCNCPQSLTLTAFFVVPDSLPYFSTSLTTSIPEVTFPNTTSSIAEAKHGKLRHTARKQIFLSNLKLTHVFPIEPRCLRCAKEDYKLYCRGETYHRHGKLRLAARKQMLLSNLKLTLRTICIWTSVGHA
jgi:hypothetical protein